MSSHQDPFVAASAPPINTDYTQPPSHQNPPPYNPASVQAPAQPAVLLLPTQEGGGIVIGQTVFVTQPNNPSSSASSSDVSKRKETEQHDDHKQPFTVEETKARCNPDLVTCMKVFYGITVSVGTIALIIAIIFFVEFGVDTLDAFGFFWIGIVLLVGSLCTFTLVGIVLACQCGWDGSCECCCCCC